MLRGISLIYLLSLARPVKPPKTTPFGLSLSMRSSVLLVSTCSFHHAYKTSQIASNGTSAPKSLYWEARYSASKFRCFLSTAQNQAIQPTSRGYDNTVQNPSRETLYLSRTSRHDTFYKQPKSPGTQSVESGQILSCINVKVPRNPSFM